MWFNKNVITIKTWLQALKTLFFNIVVILRSTEGMGETIISEQRRIYVWVFGELGRPLAFCIPTAIN